MSIGLNNVGPITAMRATLLVETAEVADSAYPDAKGREQKQFATTLRVLSGAGERDGETFTEWFSFPTDGCIGPKTKTGQLLAATLGKDARAETPDELAEMLVGKTFSAQIVASRDGQYPRVQHDTIGPASPEGEDGYGNSLASNKGPDPDGGNDFGGSLF